MSESRKVRFASDNEVKPLLAKNAIIPKLQLKPQTIMTTTSNNRGVINPLEDLVQCTLCLDRMKEPKMLTCQHTFCLNCLQYNLPSGAINVKCSICKEITNLQCGFESLEHLPGNMYIDSILKVLTDGGISARIPHTNTNTNKNVQETLCIKCQTVCQFMEHTCQHCKQNFCVNCWPIHLTEITDNIKSLIDQLSDYDTRLDHQNDIFQDRCIKIEESIRETTVIKIQELRQQEADCLKEVAEIKTNGLKSSEDLKKRLKELQKNINDELCNDKSDDIQKVSHFIAFHENVTGIFEEISHWDDDRIVFDASNYRIDREIDGTPGVDAGAEADEEADVEEEADEEEVSQYKSSIMNPLDNSDNLMEHYKSRRFAPKLTWTKCSRPANVAVAPWNTNSIYIAGTDSRNIYIIDKQKGKLLSRLYDPCMLCPVGLTFSSSELFVTDKWKHCIHVYAKQGTYLRSIGKKGNAPGQFRSPEGIAHHSNRLFVCDTGNDRIQVLSASSGLFLYSFGITGAGMAVTGAGFIMDFKYTELNMPTGIAIAGNHVIVADSGNRRIKVYTLEGNKTMEFGSLGKAKGQFRSPEVVAVDPLGFIFVGDSGNARVQVFRPNGTLVRVFGSKGKLSWVSGLCVTPQLDVIVSDYKSHTVHVF